MTLPGRADRPRVGVVVDPLRPGRLEPLLRVLRSWCDVRAWQPDLPDVAAVVATSWRAPVLDEVTRASPAVPVAVAVDAADPPPEEVTARASVLIVDGDPGDTGDSGGGPTVLALSRFGIDGRDVRPLPPFVRARWRQRLGFPDDLDVAVGVGGAPPLDEAAARTALALAPAAVVAGAWLVPALALGTAVVTDARSAEAVGAVGGRHVEIGGAGPDDLAGPAAGAVAAARALGADWRRAAAVGWAGRLLVEERHDLSTVARALAAALGLVAPATPGGSLDPAGRLQAGLDQLHTPPFARVAVRARSAWASLAGPRAEAWEAAVP
ncbi:MAG: hypothetical protein IPM45_15095 [Acidimicrobiales bacterium]|nr:hypothetical protein [Acidimicrobiales bacterium]